MARRSGRGASRARRTLSAAAGVVRDLPGVLARPDGLPLRARSRVGRSGARTCLPGRLPGRNSRHPLPVYLLRVARRRGSTIRACPSPRAQPSGSRRSSPPPSRPRIASEREAEERHARSDRRGRPGRRNRVTAAEQEAADIVRWAREEAERVRETSRADAQQLLEEATGEARDIVARAQAEADRIHMEAAEALSARRPARRRRSSRGRRRTPRRRSVMRMRPPRRHGPTPTSARVSCCARPARSPARSSTTAPS